VLPGTERSAGQVHFRAFQFGIETKHPSEKRDHKRRSHLYDLQYAEARSYLLEERKDKVCERQWWQGNRMARIP